MSVVVIGCVVLVLGVLAMAGPVLESLFDLVRGRRERRSTPAREAPRSTGEHAEPTVGEGQLREVPLGRSAHVVDCRAGREGPARRDRRAA